MMPNFVSALSNFTKSLFLLLFLTSSLTGSFALHAEEDLSLEDKVAELKKIRKQLKSKEFNGDDLAKWTQLTITVESEANLCITEKDDALLELNSTIESLGEKIKGEASTVTKSRKGLLKSKDTLIQEIAECNLYILTSESTTNRLNKAKQSYLEKKYLVRKPHIASLLYDFATNPAELFTDSTEFLWEHSGIHDLSAAEWVAGTYTRYIDFSRQFTTEKTINKYFKHT